MPVDQIGRPIVAVLRPDGDAKPGDVVEHLAPQRQVAASVVRVVWRPVLVELRRNGDIHEARVVAGPGELLWHVGARRLHPKGRGTPRHLPPVVQRPPRHRASARPGPHRRPRNVVSLETGGARQDVRVAVVPAHQSASRLKLANELAPLDVGEHGAADPQGPRLDDLIGVTILAPHDGGAG